VLIRPVLVCVLAVFPGLARAASLPAPASSTLDSVGSFGPALILARQFRRQWTTRIAP
jgi:hypothetical protein